MATLTDYEREQARAWMKACRGSMSQEELAKAMTEAMPGWNIGRDRYSKYESGAVPFGRAMLDRFISYWATRGVGGPELTPPEPPKDLDPYAVIADLTKALSGLTEELAAARQERTTLSAKVEQMGAVLEALARREMQGGEEPSVPGGRVG